MQTRALSVSGPKVLFVGVLITLLSSLAFAQDQPQWSTLMYRKSEPGKAADQRKFLEDKWRKYVQAGVDSGELKGAMALRLTAPYVSGAPFDYVTVAFPAKRPTVAPMDMAAADARARKAGFANMQEFMDASSGVAKIVKTEWLNSTLRLGSAQAGNYLRTVRYAVDDSHREQVMSFLRDVTMSLSAARMKDGRLLGWAVHTPAMISPDEAGYAMSVSAILKDADTLMEGPGRMTEEWFNKAMPGKHFNDYIRQLAAINAVRKPVATRVYEIVVVVGAMPVVAPSMP